MDDKHNTITDQNLDRLLNAASHPDRPLGAEQRLMRRIALETPSQAVSPGRKLAWLSALPLAASLAFGFYLGQAGLGSPLFDTQVVASDDAVTGFEELEDVASEDAT
jgi:anti-sigma factor RsiW